MDSFKILGVNYTDDINHIKQVFRDLVLKHHPDRGGNAQIFNKIKTAYDDIYKFKMQKLNQIKRENVTFDEYLQTRDKIEQNKQPRRQTIMNPHNLDMGVFNRIYESTRLDDAYDIGRESFLKNDNNTKREMIKIRDPSLLCDGMLQNIKEIGLTDVADLSVYNTNNKNKLECADIKYAFENKESLKDIKNPINTRTSSILNSENTARFRNERNNINMKMSREDKRFYQNKKQKEREIEYQRQFNAKRRMDIEKRQWERLSNFVSL